MRASISRLLAVVAIACLLNVEQIRAEVEKIDMPGIRNFSQIEGMSGFAGPLAGFGGATQPAAMVELKNAGFNTVINLRLASEEDVNIDSSRTAARAAGLHYKHLPFDTGNPDPAVVEEFLTVVGNTANQPVYMHCNSATRAAALWMLGRVLQDGWSLEAAGKEVEAISPRYTDAIAFATAYLASQQAPVN